MMPEIALNILDIAENCIRAHASLVEIEVAADSGKDTLTVRIADNGEGMSPEQLDRAADPFYTTRTTRKVGLGLSFFKQAAESTGGSFEIVSRKGEGTVVTAVFGLSHIDRMPLGDISSVIHTFAIFHEETRLRYRYCRDGREFILDTAEVKEMLGGVSLKEREVSAFLKEYLDGNKAEVDGGEWI